MAEFFHGTGEDGDTLGLYAIRSSNPQPPLVFLRIWRWLLYMMRGVRGDVSEQHTAASDGGRKRDGGCVKAHRRVSCSYNLTIQLLLLSQKLTSAAPEILKRDLRWTPTRSVWFDLW
jgi:hypothetical protein